jgi:hypothetical protein
MATDGRVSYRLKEKGVDLAPALLELLTWGARHQTTEAPYAAIETMEPIAKFLTEVLRRWEYRQISPPST